MEKFKVGIWALLLFLTSCISQKKLDYVRDPVTNENIKVGYLSEPNQFLPPEKIKIKPNDELLIKVSSFDDMSFNYFENQESARTLQASNELSLSSMAYAVDIDGFIYFPVVGKILVKGFTLDEAMELIKKELEPYFNQPNVTVKYAYKKITVLGEVNNPGYYTYTKDQITVFDAIGMAEDLTIHGDRRQVLVIRNEEGKAIKYNIDLSEDKSVFGYNYYLKPDDVVYVRARGSIKWREVSVPITLIFSTITTALLVYNAIE